MNPVVTNASVVLAQLPPVDADQPPGTDGLVTMLNWLVWGGFAAALAGVVIAGILMAISIGRGQGGTEGVQRLGWSLGGAATVAAATALVGAII